MGLHDVLPPGGKSSWGWAQNALVTVDPAAGRVTYNPEFYVMAHAAHFVPPGSHLAWASGSYGNGRTFADARIGVAEHATGDAVGFVRPDGAVVLLVSNTAGTAATVKLGVTAGPSRRLWRATLPPHSFSTFVFPH